MTVNEIIDSACRDLSMITDEDHADGALLDSCAELLNIAIADLNSDNYIASNVREDVVSAAGSIKFFTPIAGEITAANVVPIEPPDNIMGVARHVGIRWMQLQPISVEDVSSLASGSLPQGYAYNVYADKAPDNSTRMVGEIKMNGTAGAQFKVFSAQKLPHYSAGDTIYLSPLYKNLILYALEARMVKRYKLFAYKESVAEDLLAAKDAIDKNAAVNRPLTNLGQLAGSYMDDYYNGLGGVGL